MPKDLKKFLEQHEIMFDGIPLTNDDKEKVRAALKVVFWDAKEQNQRKKLPLQFQADVPALTGSYKLFFTLPMIRFSVSSL